MDHIDHNTRTTVTRVEQVPYTAYRDVDVEVEVEFQGKIGAIKAIRATGLRSGDSHKNLAESKRIVDALYADGFQLVKLTRS
jgi:hypothetical protein